MKRALASTTASFAAALLLALALAGTAMAQSATVMTDQSDYAPGQIVTITGSGWQAGETVTLNFVESPLIDTHPDLTAVADANGNIFNNQFSPDSHDVDITFTLTATGGSSGLQAQTTFTDAINTITITSSPFSIAVNSCSAAITLSCTGNGSTISLSSSSAGGKFYASAANCSTQTSPITTDGSTCNGGNPLPIFYRDSIAGNPTITVSAAAAQAQQTETIFGPATKLAFAQQPTTTRAGQAISPAVTVQVEDANGNVVLADTSNVTITISSGGAFSGGSTTTVAAVNGVATFSNLVPTVAGTFTLSAADGSLTGATSNSFTVSVLARRGQVIIASLSRKDRYTVVALQ